MSNYIPMYIHRELTHEEISNMKLEELIDYIDSKNRGNDDKEFI